MPCFVVDRCIGQNAIAFIKASNKPFKICADRENAAAAVPAAQSIRAPQEQGNTGTWHGPAPTGAVRRDGQANETQSKSKRRNADCVLLPGGAQLPLIGFGTDKISSEDIFKLALDAGYRHFDCAAKYENEATVGKALRDFIASDNESSGRQHLFITSKIWNDCHRPDAARASVEKSIKDLNCQYLDLLLMHWPDAWCPGTQDPDENVTIEQTWEAMEELVREGKVKHLGVANFGLRQVEKLLDTSTIKPVVNQIELHPYLSQRKMVGTCRRKGVICMAYSPLGHGSSVLLDDSVVLALAKECGRSAAQILLQWNTQRGCPVIPRSTSNKNIKNNIVGAFDWELSETQKGQLDSLDRGQRLVNNSWHVWEA